MVAFRVQHEAGRLHLFGGRTQVVFFFHFPGGSDSRFNRFRIRSWSLPMRAGVPVSSSHGDRVGGQPCAMPPSTGRSIPVMLRNFHLEGEERDWLRRSPRACLCGPLGFCGGGTVRLLASGLFSGKARRRRQGPRSVDCSGAHAGSRESCGLSIPKPSRAAKVCEHSRLTRGVSK